MFEEGDQSPRRRSNAMPLYYYHVLLDGRVETGEGIHLPNLPAAKRKAQVFAGGVLIHERTSIFDTDVQVRVTNASGLTLFEVLVVGTDAAAANDR